jgi:Asp-tRNA(Asn)/Glu-tRNA(Gln) amidotransferase C subunit
VYAIHVLSTTSKHCSCSFATHGRNVHRFIADGKESTSNFSPSLSSGFTYYHGFKNRYFPTLYLVARPQYYLDVRPALLAQHLRRILGLQLGSKAQLRLLHAPGCGMTYTGRTLLFRVVRNTTDYSKHVAHRPVPSLGNTSAVDKLLSKPRWSVRSLLPTATTAPKAPSEAIKAQTPDAAGVGSDTGTSPTTPPQPPTNDLIDRKQLHHLLRLSALPLPKTPEAEANLLQDLRSQVHFVNNLSTIPTHDVNPLVAIRDETLAHRAETTIGLAQVQPWLDLEDKVGRNGTVRRRKTDVKGALEEMEARKREESREVDEDERIFKWPVLKASGGEEGRRWGGYYVVRRGVKKAEEGRGEGARRAGGDGG